MINLYTQYHEYTDILYPILSILYLLLSFAFVIYFQKITSMKTHPTNQSLPDVLHKDEYTWLAKYHYINNYSIYIECFWIIYCNIKPFTLMNIISTIYMIRPFFFASTILPRPSITPKKREYSNLPIWKIVLKYILLIDRNPGYDNDLIFSGHTSFLTVFVLHLWTFGTYSIYINIGVTIINFISSIIIVMNRNHYTICNLVAYLISYIIYDKLKYLV